MHSMNCLTALTVAAAVFCPVFATSADDPVTWTFDETTHGEDIHWLSSSTVRPDAAQFDGQYVLSGIWVTVKVFGVPIEVDVTDQVPPEYLSGAHSAAGPAPLVLFNQSVAFPEPPEPPSLAADILIGLDEVGHGYMDAVNVYLGTYDAGFGDVDIQALRIAGKITVTAIGVANPSDINGDGVVDVLDLLAVLAAWGTDDPDADVNDDGIVDVLDLLQVLGDWQ